MFSEPLCNMGVSLMGQMRSGHMNKCTKLEYYMECEAYGGGKHDGFVAESKKLERQRECACGLFCA